MRPVEGWRRLRGGGERDRGEQRLDVDEEIRFHLGGLVEELMAEGSSEEEAREKALERFGDPQTIAERCRQERRVAPARPSLSGARPAFDVLLHDLSSALRSLGRRPGITTAILLTLALGIGATTAVFSVVNGVLLVAPPHRDPHELVLVWEVDQRPGFFEDHNSVSAANFRDWREQNRVFGAMAAYQRTPVTFRGGAEPERVMAMAVGADFLSILGVDAHLGRTFTREEYEAGHDDVVMLSHAFWSSRFGRDPEIVGETVRFGSESYPVVGILPPGFRYLDEETEVWTPLAWTEQAWQNRRSHLAQVLARLRDGVSVEQAQRDMERVVDGLRVAHPDFLTGWSVLVEPLEDAIVGEVRPALLVLMGSVAFVLVIAAVNVANLMLVRGIAERRERALRAALGASRLRLFAQQLIESLLLSLGGGVLGLAAAALGAPLLLSLAPPNLPRIDRIAIEPTVVVFTLAVSLAAGLALGLLVCLASPSGSVGERLGAGERRPMQSRSENRLASGLVVSQLAFALVLLIAAGLLATSFTRLLRVDPGFDQTGLLSLKITLPSDTYAGADEQIAFLDRLLAELDRIPGVVAAGVTKFLPLLDHEWTWSVYIEGRERDESEKLDYGRHVASPDLFRTMGIHLRRGRLFRDDDRSDRTPVVVVNEAFADRFFSDGGDPLGRRMSILGEEDRLLEIVGVVEDVRHYGLDEEPLPLYYVPYAQMPGDFMMRQMNVVVRTAGNPAALVPTVRAVLAELDRAIPISNLLTMRERVHRSVAGRRFAMTLVGVFAAVALLLALVGIFGVVSASVGRRIPEIGVRMALGAAPAAVARQVLVGGLRLSALGLLVGLPAALLASRALTGLLYGVGPYDPAIYGGLAALLTLVVLLATWLPARRASRVDPMIALRNE